ncbi:PIN domain nuclease of toxin-antitoxin system [Sphingomonas vulcanisoli]|uniref:PIN domain nuclease of toxin-antitoxin system n=1 Tax=Sphingomonas vulcanisoli TaxID=1658060 RepID=A0ABX0U0K4_9SPHN|nr:type II toxin-antitoxin system VapC family toxin [Sphingomonas vulcanisoli]NIJ09416.1 PIN domain nuclease of toxin-antitoxin system [Sphingomonas vulcanisoli]
MRLLLDTHALIWWIAGDERMRCRELIMDPANDKLVSAVSAMEIATKFRLGKLSEGALLATSFEAATASQGFIDLFLTPTHGRLAGSLPGTHGDPFDRMLAAQAILEGLTLVSSDTALDQFGVQRIW